MAKRKTPKPKVFRQVQKEVNDLIKYQFQDLDFWPKMIKKRTRALKTIFNEEFGGTVDSATQDKIQKIRDDLNSIATNSQEVHDLMGEIIQANGSTEERKILLSSWQDERLFTEWSRFNGFTRLSSWQDESWKIDANH